MDSYRCDRFGMSVHIWEGSCDIDIAKFGYFAAYRPVCIGENRGPAYPFSRGFECLTPEFDGLKIHPAKHGKARYAACDEGNIDRESSFAGNTMT